MQIERLEASAQGVIERLPSAFKPVAALVLGSGWGEAVADMEPLAAVGYDTVPALGATGVVGHAGRILAARMHGRDLLVFQGRRHWYEGLGWEPVAFPVYLARAAGCGTMVLTNAAGGLRSDFPGGTLMALTDHINAMGAHPLIGPHAPVWGPRFPDMSAVYDAPLRESLCRALAAQGRPLATGVYVAVTGPSYETPAEVRMFARWGGDAVGMSTVPEAILARAAGLRVAGLSCIANPGAGLAPAALTHDDVLATMRRAVPAMRAVIGALVHLL